MSLFMNTYRISNLLLCRIFNTRKDYASRMSHGHWRKVSSMTAGLEEVDPTVCEMLRKVQANPVALSYWLCQLTRRLIGRRTTEVLHQSYSLRELHVPSRSRSSRQRSPKSVHR
jgi:hypothetical protein